MVRPDNGRCQPQRSKSVDESPNLTEHGNAQHARSTDPGATLPPGMPGRWVALLPL